MSIRDEATIEKRGELRFAQSETNGAIPSITLFSTPVLRYLALLLFPDSFLQLPGQTRYRDGTLISVSLIYAYTCPSLPRSSPVITCTVLRSFSPSITS